MKVAVLNLCCGAFICGIISILLKNDGLSKAVKFALSLFLCGCVAIPILGMKLQEIKLPDCSDGCSVNNELYNLALDQMTKEREKAAVKEIQSIAAYEGAEIINISFEKDGFARVVVSSCDDNTVEKIKSTIETVTGYGAEVSK